MIVNYLNFLSAGLRPAKANAILLVDPDAVLSGSITT